MPQEQQPSFVDLPYIAPTMPLDPVSTLNKDIGGPGSFSELLVGAGAKAFHADSSGWWQGAVKFADAPARCDMDGNAVFNSILINGRDGEMIAAAIDENGNFIKEVISTNLNTQTKQILGSFTFGASGAIAIASDANNGLWLSPTGILGKKAGATTLAVDTGGNATFGGTLVSASGTFGTVTAGTFTGVLISGSTVQSSSGGGRIVLSNGDRLYFYDGGGSIQGTVYGTSDDLVIQAADDIYLSCGTVKPIPGHNLGSSGYYWGTVYCQAVNVNGNQGTGDDFGFVTRVAQSKSGGYVTNVQVTKKDVYVAGGIITGVSGESGWNNAE